MASFGVPQTSVYFEDDDVDPLAPTPVPTKSKLTELPSTPPLLTVSSRIGHNGRLDPLTPAPVAHTKMEPPAGSTPGPIITLSSHHNEYDDYDNLDPLASPHWGVMDESSHTVLVKAQAPAPTQPVVTTSSDYDDLDPLVSASVVGGSSNPVEVQAPVATQSVITMSSNYDDYDDLDPLSPIPAPQASNTSVSSIPPQQTISSSQNYDDIDPLSPDPVTSQKGSPQAIVTLIPDYDELDPLAPNPAALQQTISHVPPQPTVASTLDYEELDPLSPAPVAPKDLSLKPTIPTVTSGGYDNDDLDPLAPDPAAHKESSPQQTITLSLGYDEQDPLEPVKTRNTLAIDIHPPIAIYIEDSRDDVNPWSKTASGTPETYLSDNSKSNDALAVHSLPGKRSMVAPKNVQGKRTLIRYPHNLHPVCYLITLHEAYHQATLWHTQIHLTSRRPLEQDYSGKYDNQMKGQWSQLKFIEHREWKKIGKAHLQKLETEVFEQEDKIKDIRNSSVRGEKYTRLLKERNERDWKRNYDLMLNGPGGVAGNALGVLRTNGAPLIALDWLWDLLEDPTCRPPNDCLYYFPGQNLNRGNGKHPPLPDSIPVPDMFDLPRYKRPLPVWPEPRSKEQKRPLAKQGYGLDEYAAAISGPERPTTNLKPGNVAQFDGSPESRIAFWSKEPVIKGPIIAKFLKARASGTEYSDEDSAFAVDFASRIILNPFTVLKFISFVDQHDRGVLDYKELLELIFKIAGWELPTDPNTLEKLSTAASLYFVDSDTSGNVGVKKVVSQGVSKPPVSTHKTGSELDADIAPKPHPTKPRTQLTPDSMITVLSKSYLIPVSGYYYDVGEVMFRAHLEKTKEIVDLVRKGSEQGKSSAAADIQQQIEKLRVALRKWMKDLTRGAKKEKENSKKKYMARADRWKKEWDMIVREGKDMEEVFKITKPPKVDCIMVEYVKSSPRKRPFPGAPGPSLTPVGSDAESGSDSPLAAGPRCLSDTDIGESGPNVPGLDDLRKSMIEQIKNTIVVYDGATAGTFAAEQKFNGDGTRDSLDAFHLDSSNTESDAIITPASAADGWPSGTDPSPIFRGKQKTRLVPTVCKSRQEGNFKCHPQAKDQVDGGSDISVVERESEVPSHTSHSTTSPSPQSPFSVINLTPNSAVCSFRTQELSRSGHYHCPDHDSLHPTLRSQSVPPLEVMRARSRRHLDIDGHRMLTGSGCNWSKSTWVNNEDRSRNGSPGSRRRSPGVSYETSSMRYLTKRTVIEPPSRPTSCLSFRVDQSQGDYDATGSQ